MKDSLSRRSIATPLVAVVISWVIFMIAVYTELFVKPVYDENDQWIGEDPAIQAAPYLFFLATAVFTIGAVWAQRLAIRRRIELGPEERLPRAAHRFATLTIVIGLVVSAVLAISVFLEGFNTYGPRSDDITLRLLTTYLPIILYTILVVTVLLVAFVFRGDTLPKSDDKAHFEEEAPGAADEAIARKSLGGAYAIPIVAVAIALIFGLVVFDITGTTLQVWVWVIIQAMIGIGIVLGTIFGEKAVLAGPRGKSSRGRITKSARGLNFVLSIVFGAVVTVMGFGYGASAIDQLRISPQFYMDIYASPGADIRNTEFGASGFDLLEGSTVSIGLEEPERSLLSGEVDSFGDFYQQEPLPQDLEPGDYVLVGQATSADGRPLAREIPFTLDEDGTVTWDYYQDDFMKYEMEESRLLGPSLEWFFDDLLPALVLITLAQTGIYLTVTERNKRRTLTKK